MQHIAIYLRVSSRKQDTRSQEPDLKSWAEHASNGQPVKFYRDSMSGKTSTPAAFRLWWSGVWTGSAGPHQA